MSRNYLTAKNLTGKHKLQKGNKKINYLRNRQLFLRANLINSAIYKAFSSFKLFSDFFQCLFIYCNFYVIHICSIKFTNSMQNFFCTLL